MKEITDVGWGKVMQCLEDQGQDLKGNAMFNGKPVKPMKDRGDMVIFLGVGG